MGVLYGEAQRLFIPTAPGSKGAPSSQAQALCYAKPYPESAACSMARHKHFPENFQGVVIPLHLNPLSQHTHRQSLLPNSMHNSTFLASGKWVGSVGCLVCVLKTGIKDVFISVIFCHFMQKHSRGKFCIVIVFCCNVRTF